MQSLCRQNHHDYKTTKNLRRIPSALLDHCGCTLYRFDWEHLTHSVFCAVFHPEVRRWHDGGRHAAGNVFPVWIGGQRDRGCYHRQVRSQTIDSVRPDYKRAEQCLSWVGISYHNALLPDHYRGFAFQGGCPCCHKLSSKCLSRNVSMHCQNPAC